ncbi:MBL fold metallo-hydrolase [Aquabacter spiritensis]|uniref:Glyoxylase-like metal-dependent hydrolase (Beta-lactamase superfamily II) n=1 Tax=Aquabacter spiritensis TaxID=933073 RepID=A0A4R3M4L3_9HYPH|nr:MBL fold metallo-hydrolase [Aquabacter spiritensis]TCT08190.1 glyoxylase-like metal-dependent hydrolase (beta-lactamase superfamily II) [Aquabacter spiritensis]
MFLPHVPSPPEAGSRPTLVSRRRVLGGAAAVCATALLPWRGARAQPLAAGPVTVGRIKVTPLFDGFYPLPLDVVPDAVSPAGTALLEKAGIPPAGPIPTPVNAFAIERDGRFALIDAGTGPAGGAALGKVSGALAAAGLDPARVEVLILTHLHVDHASGAIGADGKALFPNAELILQHSEIEFWLDDAIRARAPQGMDGFFAAARAVLAAYPRRVRAIEGEQALWPGLSALPLPGHTPGHSGVMIADGGDALLMWADTMHVGALQFPHPDWTVLFDVNRIQAADTRARLLDRLAVDGTVVMGSHLADRGRIVREGAGYAMMPV